jgi:hypothetical protein
VLSFLVGVEVEFFILDNLNWVPLVHVDEDGLFLKRQLNRTVDFKAKHDGCALFCPKYARLVRNNMKDSKVTHAAWDEWQVNSARQLLVNFP